MILSWLREKASAKRHDALLAAAIAPLMISGCHIHSHRRVSLDSAPQPVVLAEIRGVVLTEGGEVTFSVVDDIRWTPSALEIDGVVEDPGSPDDGQLRTLSFSYDAVSRLLVAPRPGDGDVGRVRTAAVVGGVGVWVALWGLVYLSGLRIGGGT